MSEKLIKELEEFLLPYATKRFDISSHPLGGLTKTLMGGRRMNQYTEFTSWQVRAFIRCIIEVDRDITLQEIATVCFSEGYTMMKYTPVKHAFSQNMDTLTASMLLLTAEIHNWFLYLEEHGKLPGDYVRFTGIYKLKNSNFIPLPEE